MTPTRFHRRAASRLAALTLTALTALTALSGCLSLRKRYPEKRYYLVEAARRSPDSAAAPAPAFADATLSVRRFRASPQLENKGLIYRTSEVQYRADFYREFFVTPADMLTAATRQWLDQARIFKYVLDPASQARATHVLEGNVNALYGDFRNPQAPGAVLQMQFLLLRGDAGAPRILFQKDYEHTVAVKDGSPETLVTGWNQALNEVLTQLEGDLRAIVGKRYSLE